MEIKAISVGNRPLQGTRALVRIAIRRSRGLWMMRQPITPTALQPSPMHMQSACLPQARQRWKQRSRWKATRGRNPRSSSSVKSGKKIAMGGNMTDTTQLVTRYTPDTSASVSHWGAPSPRSQAKRRGSSPDSVSLSHADGTLAPDMVRYSTSPSSASMSGMPMCRRASSRSMRSWRRSADDCEGRRTTRRHSSPAAR